jgi:hypothetical protein
LSIPLPGFLTRFSGQDLDGPALFLFPAADSFLLGPQSSSSGWSDFNMENDAERRRETEKENSGIEVDMVGIQ